jgi:hypothetical protein
MLSKAQTALLKASWVEVERYATQNPEFLGNMCQGIGLSGKGTRQELLNRIRIWREQNGASSGN